MDLPSLARRIARQYRAEVLEVVQDLVRIPSENTPPTGDEKACQEYIADYLGHAGLAVDRYEPDQVAGLVAHGSYWPGRDYRGRENVASVLPGTGGGRSLLLTGHIDTVALGENAWSKPPFGAEIHHGRLYGLGSLDMKGALGAMLVLYKAIAEQGLRLSGTLSFESVVDEEEAGVNSTIAGRLRHGPVDGAVIPEVTDLAIYPAARGALLCDVVCSSAEPAWLEVGTTTHEPADVVRQMGLLLVELDALRAQRRAQPVPPLYRGYPDPTPVQVTKVYAGGWGSQVPIAVPTEGRMELILQALPGEPRDKVLAELENWLQETVERHADAFATRPQIRFRRRWMVPTAMDSQHPLVATLVDAVQELTGRRPTIAGAPYPCDLFALQQLFNIPALIFGPAGANAHAGDEYVELESLHAFYESLLLFVMKWCGWQPS
ncbi:MAG: hypothetical protein A2W31_01565 [Planctomycetes bacterium RBG_16_64_10]|nr:MAG: hypothetical protein A2W31_01565 [Planctomycetes bacterium RBG_16_64_10]